MDKITPLIIAWVKERIFLIVSIVFFVMALMADNSPYARLGTGLPYGFYQLLRILICGVSAYYSSVFRTRKGWFYLLVSLAVVFNPIFPVELDPNTWKMVDFFALVIFSVLLFKKK